MTATTRLCPMCGALITSGAALCAPDTEALMAEVRNATDLLAELDTTLARLDRVAADTVGGRSRETPLPFNVGASAATDELRGSIRAMARGPVGHGEVARFRTARARALEVIDLPDPRVFVGVCSCDAQTPLYARSGDVEVTCRTCREVWDAQPLEAWEQVRMLSGSVPRLRQWLLALGVRRSRAQLYRDVAVLDADHGPDGAKVYLLRDVLDHVITTKTRQTRGA